MRHVWTLIAAIVITPVAWLLIAFGQTQAGRYLKVIFVAAEDSDSVLVITAYDLTGKALKAFRRVALQPGETRTVTFKLGPAALALYDHQMRRVVEPGTFTVFVGTSSDDVLSAHFEVAGDTLVVTPPTPRFR